MKKKQMSKAMLIDLARIIKHYDEGASSYYIGASDALRSFAESYGYTISYQVAALVFHDWQGLEVLRVRF